MLSASQLAGNILQPTSLFVSAKRSRKGISQLPTTVEVKRWERNEQLPHWPKEVSSCLSELENIKEIQKRRWARYAKEWRR